MTDRDTLIRDLEGAPEGSRELDARILQQLDPANEGKTWFADGKTGAPTALPGEPYFTTSVDAALTALPDGYAIERFMIWPGEPSTVMVVGAHFRDGRYWHEAGKDGRWRAEAATPALAVSAAAMKARNHATSGAACSGKR